jgi:hypothetical protein
MLDSGAFPWCVVLALSIVALRFSIYFDWWNGVEGLGARLDELGVRSREPAPRWGASASQLARGGRTDRPMRQGAM